MKKPVTNKILALSNLAALIVTIVFNTLANALPLNGKNTGELSDAYPNLFVPAGITFSIWGVIYLLLTGFIVYQLIAAFSKSGRLQFPEKAGILFIISSAANTLWIIAWHWQQVLLSVVLMLVLLGSLLALYLRLNSEEQKNDRLYSVFVQLPFSVYLGWITVATIANITAFLVNAGWNTFGLGEQFWTVAVLAVAVAITALMLLRRRDLAYSLVVIWAFAGILIKRKALDQPADNAVEVAVITGIIILAAAAVLTVFRLLPGQKKQ